MPSPNTTEEWLRQQYIDNGLTMATIGRMLGCSATAVRNLFIRYGIPRRSVQWYKPQQHKKTHFDSFVCETCGRTFQLPRGVRGKKRKPPRFCSHKCYWESHPRVWCTCEHCGKQFWVWPGHIGKPNSHRGRFCSVDCAARGQTGENNPRWKGGHIALAHYGRTWKRQALAARKRDGFRCRICGAHQDDLPAKQLAVHHIRPFALFVEEAGGDVDKAGHLAHRLSNLVSLCHACHRYVDNGRVSCPRN